MEQYISKSALVAGIKKLHGNPFYRMAIKDVFSILDTLEVKEVDLDKEIQRQYNVHKNPDNSIVKDCVIMTKDGFEYFAKHFFSLGLLSAITEEDCKLIWKIGDEIPQNMSEEEFFKELLKRYKAQKGEEV